MTAGQAWGIVFGAGLGLGLWSLVAMLPKLSRPRLADRIAPYLLDVSDEARRMLERRTVDPLPVLGSLLAPPVTRAARFLARVLGGNQVLQKRLAQAERSESVHGFRLRQVVWAMCGFIIGIVIAVLAAQSGVTSATALVALPFVLAVGGVVARDMVLQREATSRVQRINDELPTVLEFLSLSLSAGEGILDSIRRISRVSSGELSREFGFVTSDVNTGIPLATALGNLARRIDSAPVTRVTEHITAALERGSPVAEVLRAQAQDARDDAKRRLLELAGRKEVAMLVPLVILILPLSIAFALLPGFFVLQAGF